MTGVRDLAVRAALVKAMQRKLSVIESATKHELLGSLDPGDRKHATVAGADCGTVSVVAGRESLVVTDYEAFLAWAAVERPDAIETTVEVTDASALLAWIVERGGEVPDGITLRDQVRPSDAKAILAEASSAGPGECPPGVRVEAGKPYVSVRLTERQEAALVEAWRSGAVGLPELTTGM